MCGNTKAVLFLRPALVVTRKSMLGGLENALEVMRVRMRVGKMVRSYPVYAKHGILDTRALNIQFGDPMVILFKKHRTAYIVYSPYATETAGRLAEFYRQQNYSVSLINSASDSRADKLQRWAVKTYSHLCTISHF